MFSLILSCLQLNGFPCSTRGETRQSSKSSRSSTDSKASSTQSRAISVESQSPSCPFNGPRTLMRLAPIVSIRRRTSRATLVAHGSLAHSDPSERLSLPDRLLVTLGLSYDPSDRLYPPERNFGRQEREERRCGRSSQCAVPRAVVEKVRGTSRAMFLISRGNVETD